MALVYKPLENGEGNAIGIEMGPNGEPLVFDNENEEDKPFELRAIELRSRIPALQAEAKKYREGFADLEPEDVQNKLKQFKDLGAKLEAYEGIDPKEAKEALSAVANMDQLIDKEKKVEIDRIKAEADTAWKGKMKDMETSFTQKISSLEDVNVKKDSYIKDLLIRGAFDRSEYIKDQTFLPSDVAYSYFGGQFKIEEDQGKLKVLAFDSKGNQIFSKANPGDPASPEEAIRRLIEEYPQKDSILRTTAGGSGSGGNISGDANKRAKLEELKNMNPTERLNAIRRSGL